MKKKTIRGKKLSKYVEENLELPVGLPDKQIEQPFSVSSYLDFLNIQLSEHEARIQGEISSVDIRERVVYFSIKDSIDGSVMSCLMWKRNYDFNGIEFEPGMEVILEGVPDIYKLSGRLSFKTSSVELVGEGALKKAYDKLKNKLNSEGLFLKERKKEFPELAGKIGLILSETGEVINDFLPTLGKHGFKIKMIDSRVEGSEAISDL